MITQAVSANAFIALSNQLEEGHIPSFEDCQLYDQLSPNTKVRPVKGDQLKNPVSYGYTRGYPFYQGKELRVTVYWPQLRTSGDWPVSQLEF